MVVGQGAREHALAHKLSQADGREVVILFGNAGIAQDFECVVPKDQSIESIIEAAKMISPDLIVIGPENYLAAGLVDALTDRGFYTFGPEQSGARLEASKAFTKDICEIAGIPTARSQTFFDFHSAIMHVKNYHAESLVIKADGLCGGKGVVVCHSKQEALDTLHEWYCEGGFERLGLKCHEIVIEEFLNGSEVSVFAAAYGDEAVLFSPMQDYKRLLDYDQGPNTGGMGAVGPLGRDRFERQVFLESIKEKVFLPALSTLRQKNINFYGLLYAGLMITVDGPKLLEFNVRFGDPETQALLHGTNADIYPLLSSIARRHKLDAEHWQKMLLAMEPTITIVLASRGYPFHQCDSQAISFPKAMPTHSKLYFASTVANGALAIKSGNGRVVSVTTSAPTIEAARTQGYGLLSQIDFAGMQYRSDIGTNLTNLHIN